MSKQLRLIFATMLFSLSLHAKTIQVSSDTDDGEGSLRQAIQMAQDGDTISFNTDMIIYPKNPIEIINKSVVVDGGQFDIELNGYGTAMPLLITIDSGHHEVFISNLSFKDGYGQNGGAIRSINETGVVHVSNCHFSSNTATSGGAIYALNTIISNCWMSDNTSTSYGAGVYVKSSTSNDKYPVYNCIFKNNNGYLGGGAYIGDNGIIFNSSFYQNTASAGGGVYLEGGTIYNSVLWNDNDISHEYGTFFACATKQNIYGLFPIAMDPFVDAENDDFNLTDGTACLNSGINASFDANSVDYIGEPRIKNGQVDLGAIESDYQYYEKFYHKTIVVNNNSSDATVKNSLPWAMLHISDNGYISFEDDYTILLDQTINIPDRSITIDGAEHNIVIDGNDQVVIFKAAGRKESDLILRNITFQNGKGTGYSGGLEFTSSANLLVDGCKFINNTSGGYGSAITINTSNQNSSKVLRNCLFENNHSNSSGGAVRALEKVFFDRCMFIANTSGISGGAIAATDATISNCLFEKNMIIDHIYGNGGALNLWKNCSIVNSTFMENKSSHKGGAISTSSSPYANTSLINCVFWLNSAPNGDHNIFFPEEGSLKLNFCAIQGTYPGEGSNIIDISEFPFKGGTNGDKYVPSSGSPLIDAGTIYSDELPLAKIDLLDNARTQGDRIDIGAYEFAEGFTICTHANEEVSVDPTFALLPGDGSASQNFAINIKDGYSIAKVTLNGVAATDQLVAVDDHWEFEVSNVSSNSTLEITTNVDHYKIHASVEGEGSLYIQDSVVTVHDELLVRILPSLNSGISSFKVDNRETAQEFYEIIGLQKYTIDSIDSDINIDVRFREIYTITPVTKTIEGTLDESLLGFVTPKTLVFKDSSVTLELWTEYLLGDYQIRNPFRVTVEGDEITDQLLAEQPFYKYSLTLDDIQESKEVEILYALLNRIKVNSGAGGVVYPADTFAMADSSFVITIVPDPTWSISSFASSSDPSVGIENLSELDGSWTYTIDELGVENNITVSFSKITSASSELEGASFTTYPNPGIDVIKFKLPSHFNEGKLKLIGLNGNVVVSKDITPNNNYLNIRSIKPGLYNVIIVTDKERFTSKIVKR